MAGVQLAMTADFIQQEGNKDDAEIVEYILAAKEKLNYVRFVVIICIKNSVLFAKRVLKEKWEL